MKSKKTAPRKVQAGKIAKVLVLDDHPIVRQGLRLLINQAKGLRVCAEVGSVSEAMEETMAKRPDIAIVDLSLVEGSGLDFVRMAKRQLKSLRFLVLSMYEEATYVERCLHAGASGYIMKKEAGKNIVQAIRVILNGGLYLSELMKEKLLYKFVGKRERKPSMEDSWAQCLSNRELEVFQLYGQGLGTREIAERLNVSVKTVETHCGHIKQKMDLQNINELIARAAQWI